MRSAILSAVMSAWSTGPHHHLGHTKYQTGWKNVGRGKYTPHQGRKEIDRRNRHAARDLANQMDRAETPGTLMSRRGRVTSL